MPDSGLEPALPAEFAPPIAGEMLHLTYRELAERLGVSADGARALARRQHWPVSRDENGRSLVQVAAAALTEQRERRSDHERAERTDTRAMAARVAEMVAALKAEMPPIGAPVPGVSDAEQARTVGLMRQFLDMYERERQGWFGTLNDLNAQLDDAKADARALAEAQDRLIDQQEQKRAELIAAQNKLIEAGQQERTELIAAQEQERAELIAAQQQERTELIAAREAAEAALAELRAGFDAQLSKARAATSAAEAKLDQTLVQHQRALSDLAIIHNDQRSLWMLERRRLEAMVEAHEQARSWRWPTIRFQPVAMLRVVFAVITVAVAGIVLARDTGPPRPVLPRQERSDFAGTPQAGPGPGDLAAPQTWPTR